MKPLLKIAFFISLLVSAGLCSDEHSKTQSYLQKVFGADQPSVKAVWVTGQLKKRIEKGLGQKAYRLREKYYRRGSDIVFILDQIGKVKPITSAWHFKDNKIVDVEVLVYRESRGGEVRNRFFTQLFHDIGLNKKDHLNREVDGITGATLSVWAMQRMCKQALMMGQYLTTKDLEPQN